MDQSNVFLLFWAGGNNSQVEKQRNRHRTETRSWDLILGPFTRLITAPGSPSLFIILSNIQQVLESIDNHCTYCMFKALKKMYLGQVLPSSVAGSKRCCFHNTSCCNLTTHRRDVAIWEVFTTRMTKDSFILYQCQLSVRCSV